MAAIVVLTTVPDSRTGRKIARVLVQNHLAACVSVCSKIRSTYRWKQKVEVADEQLLLIKTSRSLYAKLEKALKAIHPYELPEVLVLPVTGGSKKYLDWIENSGL